MEVNSHGTIKNDVIVCSQKALLHKSMYIAIDFFSKVFGERRKKIF